MRNAFRILFATFLTCLALSARADVCAICGQEIRGQIYLITDRVTGDKVEVCGNCISLPRCFICGLPVKDGVELPDGRWLCTRDAKVAVLNADDVERIFGDVHDDLDKLFARYTSFPTNVDASAIDQVDVDSQFNNGSAENSDVLGFTQGISIGGLKRYKIGLLTGQSEAQLEEVCAHELSHAWVGENVPPERHARLQRDTEEGFCEMMGYLLVDSKGEESEKKRVLANAYTRGQVKLFVEAEQEYGFDDILEWMQYGVTDRLEEGHLDEIRDVKMPPSTFNAPLSTQTSVTSPPVHTAAPSTLRLQGILWSSLPSAVINGHSFFAGNEFKIILGQSKVLIRCVNIGKNSVTVRYVDSGKEVVLQLPAH